MNLRMGGQAFKNVQVPLLWGDRAIVQDAKKRISIIALGGPDAVVEILGGKPAPRVEYEPIAGGFKIFRLGSPLYIFSPDKGTITPIALDLPECEVSEDEIRIGTNTFRGNQISGFGVGIVVNRDGMGIGAPLPANLARLAF